MSQLCHYTDHDGLHRKSHLLLLRCMVGRMRSMARHLDVWPRRLGSVCGYGILRSVAWLFAQRQQALQGKGKSGSETGMLAGAALAYEGYGGVGHLFELKCKPCGTRELALIVRCTAHSQDQDCDCCNYELWRGA
jgi:hypothetical protein